MLVLTFAAAALPGFSTAIQPASPPTEWVKYSDYPSAALHRGLQGNLRARLEINPDGRPISCEVTTSSGHETLDTHSCALMLKRARFAAIKGPDKEPLMAVWQSNIGWALPAPGRAPPPSLPRMDLELGVRALPAGVNSPARITAQLIVDTQGTIESCTPDSGNAIAALGRVACEQVKAQLSARPAHNANGAPMRSIQLAIVQFTIDEAQD
jgi:TonB family protein